MAALTRSLKELPGQSRRGRLVSPDRKHPQHRRHRALRGHLGDVLSYLAAKQSALVDCGVRRRRGEPISTAFLESTVNKVIAKRMIKKRQVRWNHWPLQPFLDVHVAVRDGTLAKSFRQIYLNFRPGNDTCPKVLAAAWVPPIRTLSPRAVTSPERNTTRIWSAVRHPPFGTSRHP